MISGHKNVIVSCLYRTPGSNTNDFSEILYDLYCLFKQMNSLKFHDLVKYRTAIVMFKLYYDKLPTLLQSRFKGLGKAKLHF